MEAYVNLPLGDVMSSGNQEHLIRAAFVAPWLTDPTHLDANNDEREASFFNQLSAEIHDRLGIMVTGEFLGKF